MAENVDMEPRKYITLITAPSLKLRLSSIIPSQKVSGKSSDYSFKRGLSSILYFVASIETWQVSSVGTCKQMASLSHGPIQGKM